jgi:polysaccharide deacetylase 2 family uncharacterized protein YibQ
MPPRKKRPRPRSNPRKRQPLFPRLLVAVLLVLLVSGIAAVKYFQSPAGRARLLDAGFQGYYAQVQEEIGAAMREVLAEHDLGGHLEERAVVESARGRRLRCLEWRITCDPTCDYVLINVALTKALERAGGTVRRSEEIDGGETFLLDVGTRRFDTHRLRFERAGAQAVARDRNERPRLALVIDDLGYSRDEVVTDILSLDMPLTISVLPSLPYSTFALERAQRDGKCTMLHLPMEPDEAQRSDLDMVTTDMDEADIRRLVERYIQSLPGIEGVNNHQGSLATADPRVMRIVLDVVKAHGLFFLDSLTSHKSIAYNTAREMGVAAARNRMFLDADTEDPEVIEQRVRELVSSAQANGTAVGIGHPRRWTLEALEKSESFVKAAGIDLVFLKDIVD